MRASDMAHHVLCGALLALLSSCGDPRVSAGGPEFAALDRRSTP